MTFSLTSLFLGYRRGNSNISSCETACFEIQCSVQSEMHTSTVVSGYLNYSFLLSAQSSLDILLRLLASTFLPRELLLTGYRFFIVSLNPQEWCTKIPVDQQWFIYLEHPAKITSRFSVYVCNSVKERQLKF